MSGSLTMTIGAATMLALSPVAGLPSMSAPVASVSPPSASCPHDLSNPSAPPSSMKGLLAEAEREPQITVKSGHAVAEGGSVGSRGSGMSSGCIGTGSGSEAVSGTSAAAGSPSASGGTGAGGPSGAGAGGAGGAGAGGAGGGS